MAMTFSAASSERVSLGTATPLGQNVTGFTGCLWVNPSTVGSGGLIAVSVNAGGNTSRFQLELLASTYAVVARRIDADAATTASGGTPANGTLVHLAGVANFTGGNLKLYINGVLTTTTANGTWTANSANTTCGVANIGSEDAGASNFFSGTVDDHRVYHRALSANEINTIYRARGRDNIINGLYSRWTYSEAVAGTAASGAGVVRDKGIGKLHGTPFNTPTFASAIAKHRRRRS